ncbi:hypothetical protein C2U51_14545 [Enterobacteriaceae bacterium ENNIH1]|nr:hypothetical protein C2U51_14545 [Enterobacteriaceae bacterium ENNIH1]
MFGESGFTHGDLLRGHNQYVGRSLKVNGSLKWDTYTRMPTSAPRSKQTFTFPAPSVMALLILFSACKLRGYLMASEVHSLPLTGSPPARVHTDAA